MKKISLTLAAAAALVLGADSSQAAVIAVIDSGTDLAHNSLKAKKWTNAKDVEDAVDNDDNGYIDDVHGWNFAESDSRLIEKRRYRNRFTPEVYKFFEVQARMLASRATAEDMEWMRQRRSDPQFIEMLQIFGNYAHGTHVAGIAAREADGAQIMPLKLIATEAPKPFSQLTPAIHRARRDAPPNPALERLVHEGLKYLGSQQGQIFMPIGGYLKAQHAQVANCSFGTSQAMVKQMLKPLIEAILRRATTDAEMSAFANTFINAAMEATRKALVAQTPGTLFVMAAGNDGANNDIAAASPANIKTDNTITVAAMMGTELLAPFSNHGAKMVEIAAPGVGIQSAIPGKTGDEMLAMSGTSQAAPAVAAAAGRVLDANPKLTPAEVKRILMETVDVKSSLQGKVMTSGILNTDRAIAAAHQSLAVSMREAIARAHHLVADQAVVRPLVGASKVIALPLPGLY